MATANAPCQTSNSTNVVYTFFLVANYAIKPSSHCAHYKQFLSSFFIWIVFLSLFYFTKPMCVFFILGNSKAFKTSWMSMSKRVWKQYPVLLVGYSRFWWKMMRDRTLWSLVCVDDLSSNIKIKKLFCTKSNGLDYLIHTWVYLLLWR